MDTFSPPPSPEGAGVPSTPYGMDLTRIKAIVDDMIGDARSYDDSDRKTPRENALAYQAGEMPDLPPEKDKSSVVEQILPDTLSMLQASLMRVFAASDRVAIYEPVPPAYQPGMPKPLFDQACRLVEQHAEQATDYINYVFLRDSDGEKVIHDLIHDGLLHGNGIVKHWWDDTPEWKVESYSGLSEQDFIELVSDPNVEVLEHTARPPSPEEFEALVQPPPPPPMMAPPPMPIQPPQGAPPAAGGPPQQQGRPMPPQAIPGPNMPMQRPLPMQPGVPRGR